MSLPERLCGLQIDDQFEFGRLHNRQIGGPFALEDAANIYAGLTITIRKIGSVTDKTANFGIFVLIIDCGQLIPGGKRHALLASATEERVLRDEERDRALLSEGRDGRVDFGFRAGVRN